MESRMGRRLSKELEEVSNEKLKFKDIKSFENIDYDKLELIRGETPKDIKQKCFELCRDYLSGIWRQQTVDTIEVRRISGGMTNQLYYCAIDNRSTDSTDNVPQEVAIRLYGPKHFNNLENDGNERLTDVIIALLVSTNKLGPKIYGLFENGQIQHFYKHRQFRLSEQNDPRLAELLFQKLARVHAMDVPISKSKDWISETNTNCCEISFKDQTLIKLFEELKCETLVAHDIRSEIDWLHKALLKSQSPRVFTHIDFRGANIMVTQTNDNNNSEEIVLCDFEYSTYGYRGFDFGSIVLEWGRSSTELTKSQKTVQKFPNDSTLKVLITAYLKESEKIFGKKYSENKINSLEQILLETKLFSLAALMFVLTLCLKMTQDENNEFGIDKSLLVKSIEDNYQGYCDENIVSLTIKNGVINGKIEISVDGKQLNVFKGIPYAEPPTGDLRFRKPLPIKQWTEPLNAFNWPNNCQQNNRIILNVLNKIFSEDCLYLNIWSPIESTNSDELRPVMFWIHGGALHLGSSSQSTYDGHVLASKGDVVVVSINYRLNTFGFLYTGTSDAPGNVGLWDQSLALEWVYDNIRYFGGDPNQITIFGESAGSWSVSLHILSPVSRNLFKNAIMNSGALTDIYLDQSPEHSVKKWLKGAELIGCSDEENPNKFTTKVIDCLKSTAPEELIKMIDLPELNPGPIKLFSPVVVDGEFLPQNPNEMLKSGDFKHDLNLLVSTTEDEGSLILSLWGDRQVFHMVSPKNLTFNEVYDKLRDISSNLRKESTINGEEVAKLYFIGLSDNNDFDLLRRTIGIAIGDYYLTCPTIKFAKQIYQNSNNKNNVYQYYFTSRSSVVFSHWMGVSHGADLSPMFGLPFILKDNFSESDRQISEQMIEFLSNFAKTGAPSPQNGAEWHPYYTIDDNVITPYYEISNEPKSSTNFGNGFKIVECDYLWNKY